jgi:hypothetical protein
MNARQDAEYGPDEFHNSILTKLTHTAKKLKDEVKLPDDFSTRGLSARMREIEQKTSSPLDGMSVFIDDLFRTKLEHAVFSKLTTKPCYQSILEVCKEFCALADGSD